MIGKRKPLASLLPPIVGRFVRSDKSIALFTFSSMYGMMD